MKFISIIAPLIAAVVAIITLVFNIRNSKGNVRKRIERKERKIQELNNQFARTYGLNDNMRYHSDYQAEKERLEDDINELKKRI